MKIIDAWTHITPPEYFRTMSKLKYPKVQKEAAFMESIQRVNPHFTDSRKRIEDLDRYSFDRQITMIHPNIDPTIISLSNEEELDLARLANDDLAKISDTSGGRIVSLGVIPLNLNQEIYTEEMRRGVHDLGFKGFMVVTNLKGKSIDEFEPLWAEAEKLEAVIYLHPFDPFTFEGRRYEGQYDLVHVFGWPFETSLILSRLIFSGILDRHPSLKIVAHHLGGMVPFFSGRIQESYSDRTTSSRTAEVKGNLRRELSKPVWEYFKQFYYDTAVASIAAIRCGLENFGSGNLVFATDYPWGEDGGRARLESFPKMVSQLNLPQNEEADIFQGNIRRLLGI